MYVTWEPPTYATLLVHAETPAQLPVAAVEVDVTDEVVVGVALEVVEVLVVVEPTELEEVGTLVPPHALTLFPQRQFSRSPQKRRVKYLLALQSLLGSFVGVSSANHLACQMYLVSRPSHQLLYEFQ